MFPLGTQPYPIYHFSQQYSHHPVPNYSYPQQPNNCQYFPSQRPVQHFYQHGTQPNDFHQAIISQFPTYPTDNNNENVENVENVSKQNYFVKIYSFVNNNT